MSAKTKKDVKHQVAKTCKGPQVPTKSKQKAKNAESREGTKKRAPVKSKGKHLCQSGKMQPKEEGFVKPEGHYPVLLCSDCSVVAGAGPRKVPVTSCHFQPRCRHSQETKVVSDFT